MKARKSMEEKNNKKEKRISILQLILKIASVLFLICFIVFMILYYSNGNKEFSILKDASAALTITFSISLSFTFNFTKIINSFNSVTVETEKLSTNDLRLADSLNDKFLNIKKKYDEEVNYRGSQIWCDLIVVLVAINDDLNKKSVMYHFKNEQLGNCYSQIKSKIEEILKFLEPYNFGSKVVGEMIPIYKKLTKELIELIDKFFEAKAQ